MPTCVVILAESRMILEMIVIVIYLGSLGLFMYAVIIYLLILVLAHLLFNRSYSPLSVEICMQGTVGQFLKSLLHMYV